MSPILVRPVREQLEHDRIIRLLPGRYKRKFEVGINPGAEQNAGIGSGTTAVFPDAVLYATEKGRRLQGVVEVETVESVNHLEAMAEWAVYGRLKVPFHLYVPVASLDVARRLSSDHQVTVAEIWSFDNVGDQVRFTLVQKTEEASRGSQGPAVVTRPSTARVARPAGRPPAKPSKAKVTRPGAKPKAAKTAKTAKPAKSAKDRPARPGRAAAPVRKTASTRKSARPAAKPAQKRAQAGSRGRPAAARKGASRRK